MLGFYKITYGFLITLFFEKCAMMKTFSYIEKHATIFLRNVPATVHEEIEDIFNKSFTSNNKFDDPVCALSNEKKIALCKLVFDTDYYKYLDVYVNKVAFFMAKFSCEEKELIYKYIETPNNKFVKKNMYSCFGRHKIISTSFIEDNYYNAFYLSAGPEINSVTIYVREMFDSFNSYHVHDFVYNVELFKLEDIFISVNDVITELKLNTTPTTTKFSEDIEKIYIREQEYYKNDEVCDLAYEKKISLCKIIYNDFFFVEAISVTLNLSASYLLRMNCVAKPIYNKDFNSNKIILTQNQNLYPCYSRLKDITLVNLLIGNYIETFYISKGPRRNSVNIFIRSSEENNEVFSILQLIENINLKTIRPTVITDSDLKTESLPTYIKIQEIMYLASTHYQSEILFMNMVIKIRKDKNELELVQEILDQINKNVKQQIIRNKKLSQTEKVASQLSIITSLFESCLPKMKLSTNKSKQQEKSANRIFKKIEDLKDVIKQNIIKYYNHKSSEEIGTTTSDTKTDIIKTEKSEDLWYYFSNLGLQTFKRLVDMKKNEYSHILNFEENVSEKTQKKMQHMLDEEEETRKTEKTKEKVQVLIRKMRLFVIKRNVEEALSKRDKTNSNTIETSNMESTSKNLVASTDKDADKDKNTKNMKKKFKKPKKKRSSKKK